MNKLALFLLSGICNLLHSWTIVWWPKKLIIAKFDSTYYTFRFTWIANFESILDEDLLFHHATVIYWPFWTMSTGSCLLTDFCHNQSYEIKSPPAPWTILWFRILGILSVENINRLLWPKLCNQVHTTYSWNY